MILDNVRYHHAKKLNQFLFNHPKLEILYLPPYSPDLNPIERAWWYMRKSITHNRFLLSLNDRKIKFWQMFSHFLKPNEKLLKVCNTIYQNLYNLEKLEFSKIKNYTQLAEYIASQTKKAYNYLFIDEIQEIEGFEKVLRSLVSEPDFDIYCTGSNAKMLSGEFATFLSGRQIEIRVHSLSYPEFLNFHQFNNDSNTLNLYLQFGGMPYLLIC